MASAMAEYLKYKDQLYVVEFVSVTEYLEKLEWVLKEVRGLKSVTYLAAAVSDFYIPED